MNMDNRLNNRHRRYWDMTEEQKQLRRDASKRYYQKNKKEILSKCKQIDKYIIKARSIAGKLIKHDNCEIQR